jgi:hypothetical protein
VLGVAVVAGLAVAALVVALTSGSGSPSLPGGAGAVPFQITMAQPGSPSFSGTVGGTALTGRATTTASPSSPSSPSSPGSDGGTLSILSPVFTYKGDLGGTPYVLHVTINAPTSQSSPQDEQITFAVTGTYGSQPVTASAMFELSSSSETSETVSFNGDIGTRPIRGVATATHADGRTTITGTVNAVPTA